MSVEVEITGLVAAALTTGSYLPQVVKTWQTRETRAISAGMYTMMLFGVALWLLYGIAIQSPAVIVANVVTFCLTATILILKLRHG